MWSQGRPAGSVERTPSPGRTGKLKHSPWTAERDRKKKRHGDAPACISEDACLQVSSDSHSYQGLCQQQHLALQATQIPSNTVILALRPHSASSLPTAPLNSPATCRIGSIAEPALTEIWGNPNTKFHVGSSRNSGQLPARFAQPPDRSSENVSQAGVAHEGASEIHSCDYPAHVSGPAGPILPDSCSAEFAQTAGKSHAFAAAFYSFVGMRKSEEVQHPVDSQGPLAAGALHFSPPVAVTAAIDALPRMCQVQPAAHHNMVTKADAAEQHASVGPLQSEPSPCQHMDTDSGNNCISQQCIPVLGGKRVRKAALHSAQEPLQQQQHRMQWVTPLRNLRGRGGSPSTAEQEPEMQPLGAGLHAAAAGRAGQSPYLENSGNSPAPSAGRSASGGTLTCPPHSGLGQRMALHVRSPLGQRTMINAAAGVAHVIEHAAAAVKLQARGAAGTPGLPKKGHSRTSSLSSVGTADTNSSCASPMLMDPPHSTLGRLQAVAEMSPADVSLYGADSPGQLPQLICTRTHLRQWQLNDSQQLVPPAASLARLDGSEGAHSPFSDATTPGPPSVDEDDLQSSQASHGDLAPMKTGGAASTKEAAKTVESFNDRLHEAVANGDAVTVGQAWEDVKEGRVHPDIDSLNNLFRSVCRVRCVRPLDEAVEMVSKAGGPNAATLNELDELSMRHELLSGAGCHHQVEQQHLHAPSSICVTP